MKTDNNGIPVELIDTSVKLTTLVNHLNSIKELSVDTEFDSFNRQYGIHLQLIQVFDGASCFLVDPLKINDLSGLWQIFENRDTCKVIYSGSNDVDVLKRNGCSPVNLFDIQIASTLCNRAERSLSSLIEKEIGIEIDKSKQIAGWGNRPLEPWQLVYASNDVNYLLRLKELLMDEIQQKEISAILREENLKLESSASKDYFPKLSKKQQIVFNKYSRQKLLSLKVLIDVYAQELNLPPFKIVQDSFLEEIVKDKHTFLKDLFPEKKFHYKIIQNSKFRTQLLDIISSIDPSIGWENERKR